MNKTTNRKTDRLAAFLGGVIVYLALGLVISLMVAGIVAIWNNLILPFV